MAAAAFPKWVMLERFAINSLRGDARTSATGTTSTGTPFQVSFVVAEPPTPSLMYFWYPEGPDCATIYCHLDAAYRDLVLLRLDITEPSREHRYEYFIYIAHSTSQDRPLLRSLPPCVAYDDDFGYTATHWFSPLEVGLLCHGEEDKFAVASLGSVRWFPKESLMKANLWVFRSSRSYCGVAVDEDWEKMQLQIRLQIPYQEDDEYYRDMLPWHTYEVVPFNNSLCFVNYTAGILVCDGILEDSPKVSYIPFPLNRTCYQSIMQYRSLCVTNGGSRLSFIDLVRQDERSAGPMAPGTGFTLTVWTLADMAADENGTVRWRQPSDNEAADVMITADQMWAANPTCLPHHLTLFPLLSMDVRSIVHLLLYDCDNNKLSMVAIDLSDGKVLGEVVPYMTLSEKGVSAEDAELAEAKNSFFAHFLPSEFPKFLNLNRSIEGEPPTSHVMESRRRKVQA